MSSGMTRMMFGGPTAAGAVAGDVAGDVAGAAPRAPASRATTRRTVAGVAVGFMGFPGMPHTVPRRPGGGNDGRGAATGCGAAILVVEADHPHPVGRTRDARTIRGCRPFRGPRPSRNGLPFPARRRDTGGRGVEELTM